MLGNYYVLLKFGETVIPLSTSIIRELTIAQDYNKFLPEIRLRLDDATGAMTHTAPFDRGMSSIYIEFAQSQDAVDKNAMSFQVYTREPKSNQSTPASEYDATGLLDVTKMFNPDYTRGFSGSIKESLEGIAKKEIGVAQTSVSGSLDYKLNLLQPNWTNAQFFNHLKDNLIGKDGEYGFKSFVTTHNGKNTFVFRAISEMIDDPVTYKFMLSDTQYEDQNPVFQYFIYDNYKMYGAFGAKAQGYTYYDYTKGVVVNATETAQTYTSLSDYFMIDESDTMDSNTLNATGRSNDFTANFSGLVKSSYGNRLVGLAKMWITTMGLPNISPGNVVQIFFPHGSPGSELYSYQYSGYWLVERVVHNMGDAFLTKLMLTRHGVDTDKDTSLMQAAISKAS